MKLTNKIALISGLGCLALVGSGFAAWTYSNSISPVDGTNAVAATAKQVAGGTISVAAAGSIELDELYKADGKTADKTSDNKIQGVATWKDFAVTASFKVTDSQIAYTDYNYTYTMSVPSAIATYVTVTDANTTAGKWDRTDNSAFTFTAPKLAFVQSMAPQDPDAYDAMVAAIKDQVITITFSVSYKY